jgi:hypothetical protein
VFERVSEPCVEWNIQDLELLREKKVGNLFGKL